MTRSTLLRLALLGAAGLALAGCGGGGGGSASTTTPAPAQSLEASFGAGFNTDYMASQFSQPVVPMMGDIIPLSLTAQPTPLH
jgi:hypothetical protein